VAQSYQTFVAWRYLMARPRKVSRAVVAVAAVLFATALVLGVVGYFALEPPDPDSVVPSGSPYRDNVLLAAVVALALAELAVVLGVVRYYFTFFTTVSIAGCGIGAMALVIVLSVMSGFETDLRNKILGSNAHILVAKQDGPFREYRQVAEQIAGVRGVVAQTPYSVSEVVIAANNNYANVIIKGIDPLTVSEVTDLDESLEQARALERLWPLADDGGIAGPPADAGPADAGVDGGAGAFDAMDPAPPDLQVDDLPLVDLSGRSAGDPRADAGVGAGIDAGVGAGGGGGGVDPSPVDLVEVADDPLDLSGGELPADGGEGVADLDEVAVDIEDLEAGIPDEEAFDFRHPPRPVIPPRVARLSGVLVGSELVKQIHLYEGEEVRIVSPLAQDTPAGPAPRTAWFRVAGTFYTGMYEYDLKFIYVDLVALQDFLDIGDQVNGIEIRVADPDDTEPVLARLVKRLGPGYRVQDWKEINRNLFSALKLEKIAMFLVLAIIILVASFSIIGNLIMVVVEKAKEIALLKTLGSSDGQIMQIFVVQGLLIGLVGAVVGVLHGLILSYLGGRFGLPLDPDVYYIDRLPIHIEGSSVVAVLAAGIVISVVATLYPAYMAARLRPVEGMRYE
jgi:lipoprotein-releasing system permease protein